MAITFETKDCVALTPQDYESMAKLCAEGTNPRCQDLLESEGENWILVATAHEGATLRGFSFFTLDRIGGTPAIVVGLSSVACFSKRKTVMRGLTIEQFKRALISFPDEDVIVGVRVDDVSAYDTFWQLYGIIPRPDYEPNGEDRAWGRRLAKRFGVADSAYSPRDFRITGAGEPTAVWCYDAPDGSAKSKTGGIDCKITRGELQRLFDGLDTEQGDSLIAHGWIRREDLVKFQA